MSLGPINSTISLDSYLDYICKKTRERLQRKYPQESSPDHCIDEWRGATRATLSSLFNDHESISDVALWKRLEWILLELAKEGDIVQLESAGNLKSPAHWGLNGWKSGDELLKSLLSTTTKDRLKWLSEPKYIGTSVQQLYLARKGFNDRLYKLFKKLEAKLSDNSSALDSLDKWKKSVRKIESKVEDKFKDSRRLASLLEYMENRFDENPSLVLDAEGHIKEEWTAPVLKEKLSNREDLIWKDIAEFTVQHPDAASLNKRRISSRYVAASRNNVPESQL